MPFCDDSCCVADGTAKRDSRSGSDTADSDTGVVAVTSMEQLDDTLAASGDRVVVLDFSAPWCR